MTDRTRTFLKNFSRLVYTLILVSGVAGPATLMAIEAACEPDCPMHHAMTDPPPCCETAGPVQQHEHAPCDEDPHERKMAASACCDGKLCLDSGLDIQETAALISTGADSPATTSRVSLSTSLPSTFTPGRTFFDFSPPDTPTPLYIRNCVFLI